MVKRLTGLARRKQRVRYALRKKSSGKVRLSVYRTGKHIYAQLIDDVQSRTLVSASSLDESLKGKNGATIAAAKQVGELIAQRAGKENIDNIVFDRGGYIFHGRVKALADAARAGGMKF